MPATRADANSQLHQASRHALPLAARVHRQQQQVCTVVAELHDGEAGQAQPVAGHE